MCVCVCVCVCVSVCSDLAVHHELAGLAEVFGEQRASHVAAERVLHTQQRSEVRAVFVRSDGRSGARSPVC